MSELFFGTVMQWLRGVEGGYFDDPRGGPTFCGIRQGIFSTWLIHHGHPPIDVKTLAGRPELIDAYYLLEYFLPTRIYDLLPYQAAALIVMDGAVQHGIASIAAMLQTAVGATPVDGDVGTETLLAYRACIEKEGEETLAQALIAKRREYYKSLADPRFEKGWLNRMDQLEARCKSLVNLQGETNGIKSSGQPGTSENH